MTLSLVFSFLAFSALAEDKAYLCVSEESTGFYFEKGSWGKAKFDVSEEKYVVRKLKEDDIGFQDKEKPYGVFSLGKSIPDFYCTVNTKELICSQGFQYFFFSEKSGRFIKTYAWGYWDGIDNNKNTPHITRGRCSALQ